MNDLVGGCIVVSPYDRASDIILNDVKKINLFIFSTILIKARELAYIDFIPVSN